MVQFDQFPKVSIKTFHLVDGEHFLKQFINQNTTIYLIKPQSNES